MKTNSLKKALSVIAMAAVAVSATSVSVLAASEADLQPNKGFTADQIAASAVKPKTDVTKVVLPKTAAGTKQKVEISVNNVDGQWASSGIHFAYDSRLAIDKNARTGAINFEKGSASADLDMVSIKADTANFTGDWAGFFITTACQNNWGGNGVIVSFDVTIPSDAKPGDIYPLDIVFKSKSDAVDRFANSASLSEASRLMEGYFFTQGIYNPESNNNFAAPAADIAKVAGLANINAGYDGYIAIEDDIPETTTAPAPATTTAHAPATTSAVAPATTSAVAHATTSAVTPGSGTTPVAPGTGTTTAPAPTGTGTTSAPAGGGKATTAKPAATTVAPASTAAPTNAPKTGVPGAGVAVAGLAAAIGTAFVLRKKED
ncbi:MAG TPA: hypothetical protein DCZ71_04870 [Ruminococcus sp.]|nr:hypothetical protein [Ruminococcus sp.]